MKLSLIHLAQRHEFWKRQISEAGIWEADRFSPVAMVIRKHHRRYNAVFQRRIKFSFGSKEISDKIVFYNKVDDFDPGFIDNVLVHEMIHQYIIQNGIKDTSAHGKIFKEFMSRINEAFPGQLSIRIKDNNPALPLQGAGPTLHILLLLYLRNDKCICAVINPSKTGYFNTQLKKHRRLWGIKSYEWACSYDVFFSRFTRCTTRLHGLCKSKDELKDFCAQFNVRAITP